MHANKMWAAFAAGALVAASAASASAETPAQMEANKKLVLEFSKQVFEGRDASKAKDFMAEDTIEHNPNVPSGLKGFVDTFSVIFKPGPPGAPVPNMQTSPVALIAEGDLVVDVQLLKRPDPTAPGQMYDSYFFDLYRIKNGKIVEHWDAEPKGSHP